MSGPATEDQDMNAGSTATTPRKNAKGRPTGRKSCRLVERPWNGRVRIGEDLPMVPWNTRAAREMVAR